MAAISEDRRSEWQGFVLSARGARAEVDWGVAATGRSGAGPIDPFSAALSSTEGLSLLAQASVPRLELSGTGGRGAAADGGLAADLGRPAPDERRVILVEEDGRFAWFLPRGDERTVELPVEAVPGSRGGFSGAARRVIRWVAIKTAGRVVEHATRTLVGAWDERKHTPRIRAWSPDDFRSADPPSADLNALGSGRSLLVIHGFMGSIHESFATLDSQLVHDVHRAYEGRTFAFDHPTLVVSPDVNAEWLLEQIPKGTQLEVDVLAHSRGGLVARELAKPRRDPRLRVRSILFVATPNDGTPLGDPERPQGLLDALTNLVGAVPGSGPLELALELVQDIVLKSGLAALRGLVAMQPGGPYLQALNQIAPDMPLRAIAADFEPRTDTGIVRTARDRTIDLYFGGVRNDLIVPTMSAYVTEGAFRVPPGQRLVLDSSRAVDHSTFWSNERVLRQFREWLRPDTMEHPPAPISDDETDPRAEVALPPDSTTLADLAKAVADLPESGKKAIEALIGGPVNEKAASTTGKRPAVVVVPGIMGSHLRATASGDLVWLDPMRLTRGGFPRLALRTGAEEFESAGLNRTYLPLVSQLAQSWDVYLADFDWRSDIRESARRLAELIRARVIAGSPSRTVHLVAHSMGGLVCRSLALPDVAADLWEELGADRRSQGRDSSGRLVMLGTPNKGSFSIPLTMTGDEMILKAVATIDLRSTAEDLIRTVATFPGVYQMLPSPAAEPNDDDHGRLYDAAAWGGPGSPVRQDLLDAAKDLHERLSEVRDPERLVYVAGFGHPTPYRIEVKDPGSFSIGRLAHGDGRVAVKLGLLKDVRSYFSTAHHGGLPADPEVLAALDELLTTGATSKLLAEEPARRGADALERPPMVGAEDWDPLPSSTRARGGVAAGSWRDADAVLQEALRITVGGGAPVAPRPRLRVCVVNGGIEHASHAVAVGHYTGLPPGGAEGAIDYRLGGSLKQRQRLGLYPEVAGTAMFVPAPEGRRPVAALVLGLGHFGSVTEAAVTQAMTQAVTTLLLDDSAQQGPRGVPTRGISSVLIGVPGRYGLSLRSSIRALTIGVIRALNQVGNVAPALPIERFELEFVELYADRAENAAQVVCGLPGLLEPGLLDEVDLEPAELLDYRGGGRPGSPPVGESGEPWVRVEVNLEDEDEDKDKDKAREKAQIRTVRFTTFARGAQSNLLQHALDLDKVRDFVDRAVRGEGAGENVSRTLFELLFPLRSKLELDPSESLHLLVDEEMAQIPWELLAAWDQRGEATELALRAGMLRQLHSADPTRERALRPTGLQALVIGDPPTQWPRLPGARAEARQVRELLLSNGWDVTDLIYDDDEPIDGDQWVEITNALYAHPYRLVHIAAHGVYDDGDKEHRRSGVVIGPGAHNRLTALDFQQMSDTPDLVFLNCCHLGRLGSFIQPERSEEAVARR